MSRHLSIKEPRVAGVSLEEAYKRILAEDIYSKEDLPVFSRSTVDGFAVNSADTFGASEGIPAYLNVSHEILMGEEPVFTLGKTSAAKIATGGMLPVGADAVVMFEDVQDINEGLIEVLKPVAPNENVIFRGEDAKKGEIILKKGRRLRPQDIAAIAAVGLVQVKVYEKPKITVISTGDEVVPAESPVRPGQVRDINSYNLSGLILENGGVPVRKGIFRDLYDEILGVISGAVRDSDMVLVTGGSSVGVKDMTAGIINSLGSPGVVFHGVALKPGKPAIGAVVNNTPVFGLPGHPAAVTVCFDLFVKPVLKLMTGLHEKEFLPQGRTIKARLSKNISSGAGREEHVRVAIEEQDGILWAVPVLGKSGLIRTLVLADGTLLIPPEVRGLEVGETVDISLM